MMNITKRPFRLAILIVCTSLCPVALDAEEILLDDQFESFEFGEVWQEHGAGAPDIALDVGVADDSEVLQMTSSGLSDEFRGIETINAITLIGLADLHVDARLRPINQGVEGSVAAAEVALIGQSGEVLRAFASNNAGPDPDSTNDWADHYEDSKGNVATSGPWPHCTPGCDSIRNLVLDLTPEGTTIRAFDDQDDPDFPTWEATIDDFTLADLGDSMTLALRQLTVDGGDNVTGFFDYILVTTSGAGLPGDFNGNSVLDAADIDDLTAKSAAGNHPLSHDLNGDSQVNRDDIRVWVKDLLRSWIGDANLDREFSSTDLVEVLAKGTYEVDFDAVWSSGDFNGDGRANSGDLVEALADGGYELGPPPSVPAASVPEPSAFVLGLMAGVIFVGRRPK